MAEEFVPKTDEELQAEAQAEVDAEEKALADKKAADDVAAQKAQDFKKAKMKQAIRVARTNSQLESNRRQDHNNSR